jgi:hypothetical protein
MIINIPVHNIIGLGAGAYESAELLKWLYELLDWEQGNKGYIFRKIQYVKNMEFLNMTPEEQVESIHHKSRRKPRRPEDAGYANKNELDSSGWVAERYMVDDQPKFNRYYRSLQGRTRAEEPTTVRSGQVIAYSNTNRYGVVFEIERDETSVFGKYWDENSQTTWYVVQQQENRWLPLVQIGE